MRLQIVLVEPPVKADNDELLIVRPSRADMSSDAEWKVVVIQNADVPGVQDKHVFDGGEWEGENLAEADVSRQPCPGDVERIIDSEEIDQERLFDRLAEPLWKLDLVDRLEAVQVSLRAVAFDDQAVSLREHDEVADVRSARIQQIFVTPSRVFSVGQVELMNEQCVRLAACQRPLQQREQFPAVAAERHSLKASAGLGAEWMVESGDAVRPEQSGQPRRVAPLFVLQIRSVVGAGQRRVGEDGEIAEQIDRANLREPLLNFQQCAEVEALDVRPLFESVRRNGSGHYPRERLRPYRAIGEFPARIYLGFNVEADSLRISPSALGVGVAASRAGVIIVGVEAHEIEDLLQGRHNIGVYQASRRGEGDRYRRESQIIGLLGAAKNLVANEGGLQLGGGQIFDKNLIGSGVGGAVGSATLFGINQRIVIHDRYSV